MLQGAQAGGFELNLENRAADLFTVELLCWEDIEELLDEYPDLLTEFESSPKRQALTKSSARFKLEPRWSFCQSGDEPGEIGEAATLIDQRHFQLGRLKLMQLRERCWDQLAIEQRLAVLSNLARAWLGEGEIRKAVDVVHCGAIDSAR